MLESLAASDWTPSAAAHLLARAGFGGAPSEISELYELGLDGAVERLLGSEKPDGFSDPEWTGDPRPVRLQMQETHGVPSSDEERRVRGRQIQREETRRIRELRADWLDRMRSSRSPLREKMAYFWHDHFATSMAKVADAHLMWRQLTLFRRQGLGAFPDLAHSISRDPAMMRWLDLPRSTRNSPNENFARELLELFTLGEGHYSEDDVREAARAFAGYRMAPQTREFFLFRRQCDFGHKTVLGVSGRLTGGDVIDIATGCPESRRFIAGKLWAFFVSETVSPAILESLNDEMVSADFHIGTFLGRLFRSAAFYAAPVRRSLIKCPVQWMVQTARMLEVSLPAQPVLDQAMSQLGLMLFQPPNVGGWNRGRSWINGTTLTLRYNLAGWLAGIRERDTRRLFDARARSIPELSALIPRNFRSNPGALATLLTVRLFGPGEMPRVVDVARSAIASESTPLSDEAQRRVLCRLMQTPEFQLT